MTGMPVFRAASGVHFILASGSPRRQAMLRGLGIDFAVLDAGNVEPRVCVGENGAKFAQRAATCKCESALAFARQKDKATLVLAADTVVCIDGQLLGKPQNPAEALAMLRLLNGRCHEVHTAVAICVLNGAGREIKNFVATSRVRFGEWPDAALAAYAASGEPDDKAGAYAIQGRGAFLVSGIDGSWSNVVGLPLAPLVEFLLEKRLIQPVEKGSHA